MYREPTVNEWYRNGLVEEVNMEQQSNENNFFYNPIKLFFQPPPVLSRKISSSYDFRPSLLFASKVGTYQGEAPFGIQ
jgi:hypothetical protein